MLKKDAKIHLTGIYNVVRVSSCYLRYNFTGFSEATSKIIPQVPLHIGSLKDYLRLFRKLSATGEDSVAACLQWRLQAQLVQLLILTTFVTLHPLPSLFLKNKNYQNSKHVGFTKNRGSISTYLYTVDINTGCWYLKFIKVPSHYHCIIYNCNIQGGVMFRSQKPKFAIQFIHANIK